MDLYLPITFNESDEIQVLKY